MSDQNVKEEALRQSEARYRALFESIDEGFCVIEVLFEDGVAVDYRFIETNPAFESQTGLRGARGRRMRELEPRHEQHWFDIYGRIALTGEPARFVQEARHLGARWFDVYAFRVGEAAEHRVGVLFRDISARRRMEQQMREADRAKEEFLAVLSHELRNPLAPLSNGVDLLAQVRDQPRLLDQIQPMMKRQLDHLVRLVDDLLDVSRIASGKVEVARSRIDLNQAIRAGLEQLVPVINQQEHDLTVELSPVPLPVEGDFERLTQVVANLLSNATRYADPGGAIQVRSFAIDGEAVLLVRDNGDGFPPEYGERLFQLFSQVPQHASRRRDHGLGVGLALSRQLVELHGGSISARSPGVGEGAEFEVRLPLTEPSTRRQHRRGPIAVEATTRRVLVVDDNRDAADSLRLLLQAKGHVVQVAYDGPEALDALASFHPDVVLLDLGLPSMSGIEVARQARSLDGHDHLVLIAVTGRGQARDRTLTRDAGFDSHLTKPVNTRQISRLLAELHH